MLYCLRLTAIDFILEQHVLMCCIETARTEEVQHETRMMPLSGMGSQGRIHTIAKNIYAYLERVHAQAYGGFIYLRQYMLVSIH